MHKSILLIISGSIAATKSLDLIRRLKKRDMVVRCILTKGGEQFISRQDVKAAGAQLYTDLFSRDEEIAMAHIHLSRQSDLVVVAPASADLIAKMAHGFADDLASATLLANNKKLLVAPAMNTQMWIHPATARNVAQIKKDGAKIIEPAEGMLACGEVGQGRMAEPEVIERAILKIFPSPLEGEGRVGGISPRGQASVMLNHPPLPNPPPQGGRGLKGLKALVTSGPTHEAIDPVRYIGNHSSGKQGHAIAAALARAGAEVTLVTGPTAIADPAGVKVLHVTTAEEMLAACQKALPVDVAVCAAAVGDWRVDTVADRKLKKRAGNVAPALQLVENPDILHEISIHKKRPKLVIGFAAETENLLKNAADKRKRKGADWIVANDVSGGKAFGAQKNKVSLVTAKGNENWPLMDKDEIAKKLVEKIMETLKEDL